MLLLAPILALSKPIFMVPTKKSKKNVVKVLGIGGFLLTCQRLYEKARKVYETLGWCNR